MDFREYFEDWYYPSEITQTELNTITPKSTNLFSSTNLLYKQDLVVPDNIGDGKNIYKILKIDLITSGNIIAIKINPISKLRCIKLNQSGKIIKFYECVNFSFKSIFIGNNVLIKYDIVQLINDKQYQIIKHLKIID